MKLSPLAGANTISELFTAMQVEGSTGIETAVGENEVNGDGQKTTSSSNGKFEYDSMSETEVSETFDDRTGGYPKVKRNFSRRAKQETTPTENGFLNTSKPDVCKYGINMIPSDPENFGQVCRQMIGTGKNFCIRKGCNIGHQGDGLFEIKPGTFYIVKESGRKGFCQPILPPGVISEDCKGALLSKSKTLTDWAIIFHRIMELKLSGHNSNISISDLSKAELDEEKAMAFKTPKKKARNIDEVLPDESFWYKKQKVFDVDVLSKLEADDKLAAILNFIKNLDLGVEAIQNLVHQIKDNLKFVSEDVSGTQFMLDKKCV